MNSLGRLWRGEAALQDAFWGWAVLGGLLVNIITSALFLLLISLDQPILALVLGYGVPVPYNLFATVAVWRSAGRFTGERHWADAARIVTVIGMIILSLL